MSSTTAAEPPQATPQFDYVYHLQLDRLLTSMRLITTHPEEHIFLTTHHVLELWFKHVIFDLKRIVPMLDGDDLAQANWLMRRLAEILKLAEAHWTVLETMTAADFAEFRGNLTGASGMQSRQFREVEVMIGLGQTAGLGKVVHKVRLVKVEAVTRLGGCRAGFQHLQHLQHHHAAKRGRCHHADAVGQKRRAQRVALPRLIGGQVGFGNQ